MPTKLETASRKFFWEISRRALASGEITDPIHAHALQLHIAGRYEDAIAELTRIREAERSAAAWRVLGHAEHGRKNYEAAIAAHQKARGLRGQHEQLAASDDEVNLAAVLISMRRYDEAWAATETARELAPASPHPWIPRLSILNRQARSADLENELRTLITEMPDFVRSPIFRDHLENDADFIGVADIITRIRRSESCGS
jgi:tetratricopeptide (TPR) repeat protein